MKIVAVSTHPIQYQVPWFQQLTKQAGVSLKVLYAANPSAEQQGTGFGVAFKWDIPMLEGYEWEVLANRKPTTGLRGFFSNSAPAVHAVLKRERPDAVILTGWQS